MRLTIRTALLASLAPLALVTACARSDDAPTSHAALVAAHGAHAGNAGTTLDADQLRAIAEVRRATARFHDWRVAKAEGYDEQWPAGCFVTPDGGQGYHFRKRSLEDGTVDLRRPELLMYEARRDGSLQLVGVDYVVPVAAWQGEGLPSLLGQSFALVAPLERYTLHIWAWRPNPSGMFAPWNPSVGCDHAWRGDA